MTDGRQSYNDVFRKLQRAVFAAKSVFYDKGGRILFSASELSKPEVVEEMREARAAAGVANTEESCRFNALQELRA